MGDVFTKALIESLFDLHENRQGRRGVEEVRRIEVCDALVDLETMALVLPRRFIAHLGLRQLEMVATREGRVRRYDPVRITIQDRVCTMDVLESRDDTLVVVGRLPLLMMDLVVDRERGCLTGNPAHGGEQVIELYHEE